MKIRPLRYWNFSTVLMIFTILIFELAAEILVGYIFWNIGIGGWYMWNVPIIVKCAIEIFVGGAWILIALLTGLPLYSIIEKTLDGQ